MRVARAPFAPVALWESQQKLTGIQGTCNRVCRLAGTNPRNGTFLNPLET